jgi:hypothetical protein
MSATVYVDGESISIDPHTTGKEVKEVAGAEPGATLVHHNGTQRTAIPDDELVTEYVHDGDELAIEDPDAFEFGDIEDPRTSTGRTATDQFTVVVNNEAIPIDTDTTAGELKDRVGADPDDVTVYDDTDREETTNLHDDAVIADHVPDGGRISYQPGGQNTYGNNY